ATFEKRAFYTVYLEGIISSIKAFFNTEMEWIIMLEFLTTYYIYIQIVAIVVLIGSLGLLKTAPSKTYKVLFSIYSVLLVAINILIFIKGHGS
ncbi:hypothetical protein, partial [Bacillus subtilis]|uniref:hypothetical protein n=1 Tax=Bacillus subtilis TaxID=1423 RepID=UPI0034E2EAF4